MIQGRDKEAVTDGHLLCGGNKYFDYPVEIYQESSGMACQPVRTVSWVRGLFGVYTSAHPLEKVRT